MRPINFEETNMKRVLSLTAIAAATLGVILLPPFHSLTSFAQTENSQAVDPRVENALDAADLKYEVTDSGSVRVVMRFEGERIQVANVQSRTHTVRDMEIREISSAAYISQGPLPAEMANQLLVTNSGMTLGSWEVVTLPNDDRLLLFTVRIKADSRPEDLHTAVLVAASTADRLEAELSDEDYF